MFKVELKHVEITNLNKHYTQYYNNVLEVEKQGKELYITLLSHGKIEEFTHTLLQGDYMVISDMNEIYKNEVCYK